VAAEASDFGVAAAGARPTSAIPWIDGGSRRGLMRALMSTSDFGRMCRGKKPIGVCSFYVAAAGSGSVRSFAGTTALSKCSLRNTRFTRRAVSRGRSARGATRRPTRTALRSRNPRGIVAHADARAEVRSEPRCFERLDTKSAACCPASEGVSHRLQDQDRKRGQRERARMRLSLPRR